MSSKPYPYDPGIYNPIRQAPIKDPRQNIPQHLSVRLYKRRKAAPSTFKQTITSRFNSSDIKPSWSANYGRGKRVFNGKGVPMLTYPGPIFKQPKIAIHRFATL